MIALPTVSEVTTGTVSKEEFLEFLRNIQGNIGRLSSDQQATLLQNIRQIEHLEEIEAARTQFLPFIRLVFPSFKFSSHGQHHLLADAFERMAEGGLKRLTVSMPPRFGKSETGSVMFPAWFIGRFPEKKVIQASANDMLATDFGRKVKAIIQSPIYQKIFPGVALSADSKASGKFATNQGGTYFAVGVTSGVAGLGADLFVADDIVNEQDARTGDQRVYEAAWTWFQTGPQQRLQPGGRILMIGTRWSKADPIGKVKRKMKQDSRADQYESIEFPALDENESSTFPELWPNAELIAKKNNMAPIFWSAQYQQNPTSAESSIIPKMHWKKWEKYSQKEGGYITPECHFTIMALDTAYTKNKRSNSSAATIWGVFEHTDETGTTENNLILLHTFKRRMEFGALKVEAKALIAEWKPDSIIVEAKNVGPALRSELQEAGIYTEAVNPKPGEDKTVRLNSVSDVFRSGKVWYVTTQENEETVQEVNDFPAGEGDDVTDTVAYAVRRFRQGGLISTSNDLERDDEPQAPVSRAYY